MKLIIDISEEAYNGIKMGMRNRDDMREVGEAIENGTPLEKIRAEIDKQEKWLLQAGYNAYNVDIAFDAIKAIVSESEGKR